MENKTDHTIREKLRNWQLPYDEQAWKKMEQLLNQKKDNKRIFFWWLYGMMFMLLLGVAVYRLYDHGSNRLASPHKVAETDKKKILVPVDIQTHEVIKDKSNYVDHAAKNNTINQQMPIIEAERKKEHKDLTQKKDILNKNVSEASLVLNTSEKQLPNKTEGINARHSANKNQPSHLTSSVFTDREHSSLSVMSDKSFESDIYQYSGKSQDLLNSDEGAFLSDVFVAETEQSTTEVLEYPPFSDETTYDTISSENNSDPLLHKSHKKKFHYSLGMVISLSGTVGGAYSATPSFFTGITNEFLFCRRLAVTAGINYANTFLTIFKPQSEQYVIPPAAYSSNIREVMIPLGVKIYPLLFPKLKMYINSGVIHHIKLKETFSYLKPPSGLVPTNPPVLPTPSVLNDYPTQTNFNAPAVGYEALLHDPNAGGQPVGLIRAGTADFSVNRAGRYYTSASAGIGCEYLMHQRWIIFVETLYFVSIQEIGVQQLRKSNIGGLSGIRVQF